MARTKEEIKSLLEKQERLIELDEALTQILMTCRNISKETRRPFFFIVGAGISYPPVPLASDIIKECQEEVKKYYADTSDPNKFKSGDTIGAYSHWVGKAFPHRGLRQLYFKKKIERQYLSDPNLCLAHLLLDNTITNLVVTTNFDDFLARALTLFNKQHVICDHPKTAQRIDPEQVDLLQLIHVHGTYWFYDSSNLREEIEKSASSSSQMQPLLANILWNRSPLVIGYSGWENDVIMTSLSRRLESDLRFNMYWFCYKYSDAFNVPEFLYDNSQVYFVVPKPEDSQTTTTSVAGNGDAAGSPPESSPPSGKTKRIKAASLTELNTVAKKQHDEFSLPADKVLVAMARKFELENPPLTKSPLGFFSDHLLDSLPKDPPDYDNVFLFKEVIRRIKQADAADRVVRELSSKYGLNQPDDESNTAADFIDKLTAAMIQNAAAQPVEAAPVAGESPPSAVAVAPTASPLTPASMQQVDEVLNALRSHRYVDAIKKGKEIPVHELPTKQIKDLMDAMWQAALGLYDNSENELDGYDTVIKVGGHLIHADPANADTCRLAVAKALFNKGRTFYAKGDYQNALDAYTAVVREFGDEANDATLREQVAKALLGIGATNDTLGQHESAINTYDEVAKRYRDAEEIALQICVGVALYNKGVSLAELDRNAEAIEVYDEMFLRFRESTEPRLRKNVVNSLNNAGYLLLCQAKQTWNTDGTVTANLIAAQDRFNTAFQLNPDEPLVLGNLGYVLFLLGKRNNKETLLKHAENYLKQAITIGGDEIRQTELEDAERFPLPVDEEFKALVRLIKVAETNQGTPPS